jgi:putative PEP-CTERM system histidine kinase
MPLVGVYSYSAGALAFLMLALVLLTGQRGKLQKQLLLLAAVSSFAWMLAVALQQYTQRPLFLTHSLELLRNFAWIAFLARAVTAGHGDDVLAQRRFRSVLLVTGAFMVLLAAMGLDRHFMGRALISDTVGIDWLLAGHMGVAVFGLILVEQLIRNVRPESRRAVKYLCVGVGGLLVYDFYLYSDALLFQRIDGAAFQARGIVNALVVPVIAIAMMRDPHWSLEVHVSRRVVFHTVALLGTGTYLLAMGVGGYFVRSYGGSWGAVAQVIFLFAALLLLAVLLFSGQLRAYLRVIISKHFFHFKYEYRDEWLRFISTLSSGAQDDGLRERTIQAIANILDSPGGLLWLRRDPDRYECVSGWCMSPVEDASLAADSEFTRFLEQEQWIVNLEEYEQDRNRYGGLRIPACIDQVPEAWVITPLILHDRLMGFVLLTRSPVAREFNWEDYDLLRTVGQQAAAHLAQLDVSKALADAKQFEACSQLSAYVMHDLKNLIAQLSLVVTNAARHKHNPRFMEDTVTTVENSVEKMSRLLAHIRSGGSHAGEARDVDVCEMLWDVVDTMSSGLPVPRLDCQATGVRVRCNLDRFAAVVGHVIRNAQDATPDDGQLMVRLFKQNERAVVEVQDTGEGMDQAFIQEQLFRPFVSTKGATGMGIGAYETREFIRGLGGEVEVFSRPGEGTTFRMSVPISEEVKNPVKLGAGEQGSRDPNDNKYKETASC